MINNSLARNKIYFKSKTIYNFKNAKDFIYFLPFALVLGCQNDDGGGAYIRCMLVTISRLFYHHVILSENH